MTKKIFKKLDKSQRANHLIAKHGLVGIFKKQDQMLLWEPWELVVFYYFTGEGYTAVDNRTGDCWVEDFKTAREAWLYCHDVE